MTSRDDVDIQVLEWDSEYITYDSTVRTTYNTKQYNGIRPGQSDLDKYEVWPT